MKPKGIGRVALGTALLALASAQAYAQGGATKPATPASAAPAQAAPDTSAPDVGTTTQPLQPTGPMVLLLRGLDKITGRPTDIVAPIGKPMHFFTLTITARYCYSTPASETPETAAFVQIDDHRPDQSERRIFSGWMYASSPGLNAVEHPLYDVWAISCNTNAPGNAPPEAIASTTPVKVASPDSSDKAPDVALPAEAGK